jgi:hypothetical protein
LPDIGANFFRAISPATAIFSVANPAEDDPITMGIQCIRAGKAVKLYWNLTQFGVNAGTGTLLPSAYDPAALPAITLIDPNNVTQVTAAAMTKEQSGLYSYEYTTSSGGALGVWSAWVDATDPAGNPAGSVYQTGQSKATPVFQLV